MCAHVLLERKVKLLFSAGIICSNSTIEVLKQGMKYVQSQEERPQNNIIDMILEPCSIILTVDFEHVMPEGIVKMFFIVIK